MIHGVGVRRLPDRRTKRQQLKGQIPRRPGPRPPDHRARRGSGPDRLSTLPSRSPRPTPTRHKSSLQRRSANAKGTGSIFGVFGAKCAVPLPLRLPRFPAQYPRRSRTGSSRRNIRRATTRMDSSAPPEPAPAKRRYRKPVAVPTAGGLLDATPSPSGKGLGRDFTN